MGQVNVTISGRQYRMACEDGQEDHLFGLAQDIDGRIAQLRKAFGEIGDQRLTMMVAIMVADELHEAKRSVGALKAELAAQREGQAKAAAEVEAQERAAADSLHGAAQRIEKLAQSIATAPRDGPGLG